MCIGWSFANTQRKLRHSNFFSVFCIFFVYNIAYLMFALFWNVFWLYFTAKLQRFIFLCNEIENKQTKDVLDLCICILILFLPQISVSSNIINKEDCHQNLMLNVVVFFGCCCCFSFLLFLVSVLTSSVNFASRSQYSHNTNSPNDQSCWFALMQSR